MGRYATGVPRTPQGPRIRTPSLAVTDSLFEAALSILEDEGIAAVTVRSVASKAGVAPMGVYSRFGSKDGLLQALFIHGFESLERAITPPAADGPVQRLIEGCLGYRQFAIENPQLYHLMFEQMMLLELSPEAQGTAKRTFEVLVDRVQAAMSAGELETASSTDVAQQIWSAIHGAVSLEIAGVHFAQDRAANYTGMLDALLRGLSGQRPSRSTR